MALVGAALGTALASLTASATQQDLTPQEVVHPTCRILLARTSRGRERRCRPFSDIVTRPSTRQALVKRHCRCVSTWQAKEVAWVECRTAFYLESARANHPGG